MLELRRVSKHFSGIPAVDDVSFAARPGEVTGYLGPNGSGKSTTMKMITGLIERTYGQILFDGKPIEDDLISLQAAHGLCSRGAVSLQPPIRGGIPHHGRAIARSAAPGKPPSASTACFACSHYLMIATRPSPATPKGCARRS